MEFAKLVLRSLLTIAGFGGVLGAVSALICPEAFTLGRPPAFGALPAPVLGFLWGTLEFLMPGVVIGLAIGMSANIGDRPAVKALFFKKPLLAHAVVLAVGAVIAGAIGWHGVASGRWPMLGAVAAATPDERHTRLGAVWWATRGAHVANLAGGIALAIWTWRKRAEFDAHVKSGKTS